VCKIKRITTFRKHPLHSLPPGNDPIVIDGVKWSTLLQFFSPTLIKSITNFRNCFLHFFPCFPPFRNSFFHSFPRFPPPPPPLVKIQSWLTEWSDPPSYNNAAKSILLLSKIVFSTIAVQHNMNCHATFPQSVHHIFLLS